MICRVVLVAGGAVMTAYGILRLVRSAHSIAVRSAITWFIGGALGHDLLLAPLVVLAGTIVTRLCHGPIRPFLQSGLIATGALTLVAIPVLTGRGYSPKVPSALPLNYWRGYFIALGCIWLATALAFAFSTSRHRRGGPHRSTLPVRK